MTLTENLLNYLPEQLTEAGYPIRMFKRAQTISGGDINEAFHLSSEKHDFFIKINRLHPYPDFFEKEARGLKLLHDSGSFRIPKVIIHGSHDGQVFLVLEMISSIKQKPDDWDSKFAEALVKLHRNRNRTFGLDHDNYIGSLPQANKPHHSWPEFFITQRLEPQLQMGERMFDASDRRAFQKLFSRLEALIPEEEPSLLHGDLWSGNYLVDSNENPVVIDPAVYYGHREMDIAMMYLFGGFDMEIFHQYQQAYPMEENWQERIELHNLYPLLVHANLFGGHYPAEVRRNVKRYL